MATSPRSGPPSRTFGGVQVAVHEHAWNGVGGERAREVVSALDPRARDGGARDRVAAVTLGPVGEHERHACAEWLDNSGCWRAAGVVKVGEQRADGAGARRGWLVCERRLGIDGLKQQGAGGRVVAPHGRDASRAGPRGERVGLGGGQLRAGRELEDRSASRQRTTKKGSPARWRGFPSWCDLRLVRQVRATFCVPGGRQTACPDGAGGLS